VRGALAHWPASTTSSDPQIRSVRVVAVERLLGEPLVVVIDESWHEGVGGFDARDAFEPQFLNEPVLQRQMCPFHATLSRRGIGTNPVDIKLVKRPSELRVTWSRDGARLVDTEDAGLVAVERERLAEALQVLQRRFEI
jgi:hypothetical protein